jgi:hypothetical protein
MGDAGKLMPEAHIRVFDPGKNNGAPSGPNSRRREKSTISNRAL